MGIIYFSKFYIVTDDNHEETGPNRHGIVCFIVCISHYKKSLDCFALNTMEAQWIKETNKTDQIIFTYFTRILWIVKKSFKLKSLQIAAVPQ